MHVRRTVGCLAACVLLLLAAPCVTAQAPVSVTVVGTVFDSVTMRPVPSALIRLVRADDPTAGRSVVADSLGAFRLLDVTGGTWLATFLHPMLDSLRLEPGVLRLELTESGTMAIGMTTPSAATLAASTCGRRLPDDEGLVVGSVRDAADDGVLSGVQVSVAWPEWTLGGVTLTSEMQTRTVRTDSLGRYALCGVPRGSSVTARSVSGADSTGEIVVAVPAAGYALQDFLLSRASAVRAADAGWTRDAMARDSAALVSRDSRTRVPVRGRVVRDDAQPVRNAVVRVLASGSAVRTADDGTFVIPDAAAGTQTIEARLIGYVPDRRTLDIRDGGLTDITLTLSVQRVQLDTVRVMAGREVPYQVRAIERRARSGTGTLLSGDMIRERSSMWVTDALRGMNGLRVSNKSQGNSVEMRSLRGEVCTPAVYIDGIITQISGGGNTSITIDDFVARGDVAAIEVYARANLVPPEFNVGSTGCGAIAVWSRFVTGNVRVISQEVGPRR